MEMVTGLRVRGVSTLRASTCLACSSEPLIEEKRVVTGR